MCGLSAAVPRPPRRSRHGCCRRIATVAGDSDQPGAAGVAGCPRGAESRASSDAHSDAYSDTHTGADCRANCDARAGRC